MSQITVRLTDGLVASLDCAAIELRRTRAEVLRQAIEYYLEDFEDLNYSNASDRVFINGSRPRLGCVTVL